MSHANLVLAYHGCDITLRDDLVAGRTKIKPSKNGYDWLGTGIYLYEADPVRAMEHATMVVRYPERLLAKTPIATPAVVGVVLDVAVWLDMSTQRALNEFGAAAATCRAGFERAGTQAPTNRAAFEGDQDLLHRAFDKAAFDILHELRAKALEAAIVSGETATIAELLPYQAVRSAFTQGQRLAEGSGFYGKNHTQIAVLDEKCIRGYFIPAGHQQLLSNEDRSAANQRLEEVKVKARTLKRRVRVSA